MMKFYDHYQATGDLGKPDLLSNRVFGGITRKMAEPQKVLFLTAITCLHPCKDETEWKRRTNEMLDRDGWTLDGEETKRAAHIAAWAAFWNRSRIDVTPTAADKPRKYELPTNQKLPVSFGVDSKGGNRLLGKFSSAEVEIGGRKVHSGVPRAGDRMEKSAADALRAGVGNGEEFCFACRFTTDRFRHPQRLLDNVTPGKPDGFLIDVLNGRIRMVAGERAVYHSAKLQPGREVSLEVTVSPTGDAKMSVDGKSEVFRLDQQGVLAEECAAITTAYAAQRYLIGCTARGRLPTRFNGSLFTISHYGDPDYRRWGTGYWWQNTRLTYYPMFAAGDLDMIRPLFKMYLGLFDFSVKRTRKYLNHGGAYIPECI
jgi:hypothetical protein